MNVMKKIKHEAKLQSESCLFNIVLCLSSGLIQDERFESVGWWQTVGICECWDTIREILKLLFPEEQWPDWRRILPLVAENLKHLPPDKPDWWYRKKIRGLLSEREQQLNGMTSSQNKEKSPNDR